MCRKVWTVAGGLFELPTLIFFFFLFSQRFGESFFVRFCIVKVSDCNSCLDPSTTCSYSDVFGTSWRRCSLWFNSKILSSRYMLSPIMRCHILRDFEESAQEPAVLCPISLQWHLLIFPHSPHVNQHHPLQLHRELSRVDQSSLQV
jgi:hypothetical protein